MRFPGKLSPKDFAIVGPRIGYAGDLWLPYLRVGAIITTGSHNSTLSYTPAGATKSTRLVSAGAKTSKAQVGARRRRHRNRIERRLVRLRQSISM